MRTTSRLLATALTFATVLGAAAFAQQPPTPTVRIRGAIEAVDGNVLSIKTREGKLVEVDAADILPKTNAVQRSQVSAAGK